MVYVELMGIGGMTPACHSFTKCTLTVLLPLGANVVRFTVYIEGCAIWMENLEDI